MIRLLLVDDQPVVRQGLRMRLILEPDITVVGEASTGGEAIAPVQQLCPDVVLMDIEMPDMDGIAVTSIVRATTPQSAVVMLSMHDDAATRARARTAGAAAFVEKRGRRRRSTRRSTRRLSKQHNAGLYAESPGALNLHTADMHKLLSSTPRA